jgi:transcriptional regulator of nitric oxide reductase
MSRSPEISARIMWGLALLNQRKIERLNRSLFMVNEMFTQTLEQYVPKDHPVQNSWREESKALIASTPSSLEVYAPLERIPEFVQDLPKISEASFEISLEDAQDMLDAEQDE